MGGGEWWVVEGDLYSLQGLFELAMSSRNASHRHKHAYREPKKYLTITGVNFRPMSSMWCPQCPIISVMTLHGWQNLL